MSGFHNPLQMTPNTYQVFPYPGPVHPNIAQPWVDGTGQNVGFPTNYASAGYQQMNGQLVYPVNIVQSSPRFVSAMNPNHLPPVFQDALPSPTTLWNPGGVVLQSQPNLLSPVTLTNPMVANPQFLPHNFHSSPEQLIAQSIAGTSSMTPVTYAVSPQQPLNMSLTQLSASYQQQIMMLQKQLEQQQQQKEENEKRHLLQQQIELLQQQLQKQQEQHKQEQHHNLQQQQLEQLQQQLQKQQEHQKQEQHQKVQLEQPQLEDKQLQDQQEQQVVPEQQNQEQEPPEQASNEESSEDQLNNDSINTHKDANQNITSTQQEAIVPSIPTKHKHTPTVQAAASETQPVGSSWQRQNSLPATFPTSLNPSLKVQMQSTPVTTVSSQKTGQTSSTSQAEVGLIQLRLAKKEFQGSHNGAERSPSLSSPESPTSLLKTDLPDYHIVMKPIYEKPKHKHDCLRCNKKVYHMEKTGPIKDVVYHKSCFTCVRCGTILTVKNFHHNPNDADDLSVFCTAHKPKERTLSCDASAVHIKSALSVPKLDRVNEQIRSDRHPSEVLTRRRSSQVAGTPPTTTEHLYYGMEQQSEPVTSGGAHQLQQEVQRRTPHQSEQQEQQNNHQPHEQPHRGEHKSSKQKHHEEAPQQHSSNMKQTHLENDKKRINELGNIKFVKLTQNGETNSLTSGNNAVEAPSKQPLADDALFLRNSILPVLRGDAHSSPSLLPSSITQQEITAADSVEQYLATHFKLDNHKNWVKLNDNHFSPGETKVVPERERASMQSSRSTSPIQVQTSSRSTDDSESRSSYSSNLSSRDSVDLGVSAVSYNGRHQQLRSGNERADRPSSFVITPVSDEPNGNPLSRTDEKNRTSNSQEVKHPNTDTDRFLPKNERMRMDRPSQYS